MSSLRLLTPGQKFGRWTILCRKGNKSKLAAWECLCDCGRTKIVAGARMLNGETKSCGCFRIDQISTHKMTGTNQYVMWESAKRRSKKKNLPFNISIQDVVIPEKCPLLGIILFPNKGGNSAANSPTLDRIIPHKGYVKGNVRVISNKANLMKQDATLEELETLVLSLRFLAAQSAEKEVIYGKSKPRPQSY